MATAEIVMWMSSAVATGTVLVACLGIVFDLPCPRVVWVLPALSALLFLVGLVALAVA